MSENINPEIDGEENNEEQAWLEIPAWLTYSWDTDRDIREDMEEWYIN